MARRINKAGLDLIKDFEGLKLEAYLCPAGVWTIGYGSTGHVKPGQRITQAQAEQYLQDDIKRFEAVVSRLVRVPLTDNQFSALVSFTFNVGVGAFERSTLLRLLNQGKYKEAGQQLLRWDKAGGRSLPGLARRRRAELALWEKT